jgi:hypothetical protein
MSDPIGDFSLKHTGTTYARTAEGNLASYANFTGTATGYGQVFGTLILDVPLSEAGATSGSLGWAATAYLDDGTTAGGLGEGTYEQVKGEHKWKVNMVTRVSSGESVRSEGVVSLKTLDYTGKLYALD